MLPVANKPILEYVIEALAEAGVDEIILVVGYQRDRIQTYFGDGDEWDVDIEYVIQEKQLGTGHAVQQLQPLVEGPFLVLNGDRIIESELIERILKREGETPVVSITRVEKPRQYGVIRLDNNQLAGIDEKPEHDPASDIINAGVYCFPPTVFDAIAETEPNEAGEISLTKAISNLAANQSVDALRYRGLWMDISQLWDLLSANDTLLERTDCAAWGAIDPTAAVADRVCTGEDATVGPNATIRGGTTLGPNVTVEANAVVSNSVVMQDATIADGAVVRDCIVSENAIIGPNTTVTGGRGRVVSQGTVHEDILLGGVIGDNTRLGGNVTVRPGTIIGDDSTIEDSTVLEGRIEPNTTIRRG